MARQNLTFEALNKALTEEVALGDKNPHKVVAIADKPKVPKDGKVYNAEYFPVVYNVGGTAFKYTIGYNQVKTYSPDTPDAKCIRIAGGVSDPETRAKKFTKKPGEKQTDSNNNMVITLTKATSDGVVGTIQMIDAELKRFADAWNAGKREPKRVFYNVQTFYPDDFKDKEKRGKDRDDPITRARVDLTKYPLTWMDQSKRGMPKTMIKDYREMFMDTVEGKKFVDFKPARVDGKLLDETNVHKFLRSGSKIVSMTLDMSSVSISGPGIAMTRTILEMVVDPAPAGRVQNMLAVDDDDEVALLEERIAANHKRLEATKPEESEPVPATPVVTPVVSTTPVTVQSPAAAVVSPVTVLTTTPTTPATTPTVAPTTPATTSAVATSVTTASDITDDDLENALTL